MLAVETLRDGVFDDLGYPVADVEVVPNLDGSPENMWAWLIFEDPEVAQTAGQPDSSVRLEERARVALASRGFPVDALPSFHLRYTSLPEIEAGGGRFSFFR
jgi:hypothetical protein